MMEHILLVVIIAVWLYFLYTVVNIGNFLIDSIKKWAGKSTGTK